MAGLGLLTLLLCSSGTAEVAHGAGAYVRLPTVYTSRRVEVDEGPPMLRHVSYANGNLWVDVNYEEIWHFDSSGKLTKHQLPSEGKPILGFWADGTSVVAYLNGEFLRLSSTGTLTSIAKVEDLAMSQVARVTEGYVGVLAKERQLLYVSDHGQTWPLSFAMACNGQAEGLHGEEDDGSEQGERHDDGAREASGTAVAPSPNGEALEAATTTNGAADDAEDAEAVESEALAPPEAGAEPDGAEEEDAPRDRSSEPPIEDKATAAVESRVVGSVDSTLPPGRGLLTRVDEQRVAYYTDDPPKLWVIGLDGSSRCLEVDETMVQEIRGWAPPYAKVVGLGERVAFRAEVRGDRLAVFSFLRVQLELTKMHAGRAVGTPTKTNSTYIDFIDIASGNVVERVDILRSIDGPGIWAGFHSDDSLAFFSFGPGATPYLTIASPQ